MAGKGSRRRPTSVSSQQVADNWELAFGKKETVDIDVLDVYNEERLVSTFDKESNKPLDNNN
jgi:hypothetical protein